jgi:flavin-dependent dehydrogenase/RimJ/RimL family protein N-acetyltransferase
MTRRATLRGEERTPLDERADVLICGASFAGLAVARELAGSGADVLVIDRYEIGERQTSACAIPTPWLEPMGIRRAARQELACMSFHTPHGTARHRLPWSWTSFDYRALCEELWEQCDARFEVAKVERRDGDTVITDRGPLRAPLIVDALGWRRVLGPGDNVQPPEARISRGLEVHPEGGGVDLDVWIDRSLIRRGFAWSVPATGEQRVGVGSYEPRDHVKEPTRELAARVGVPPVRYQGNWFPHQLRPAVEDGVFFVGDSAGHCFPLSGEGIRTAFYFGIACGRELRAVLAGERTREAALAAYGAFSRRHARAFTWALALQRAIPALPPRLLARLLALVGRRRLSERAYGWYLRQADPAFAAGPARPLPAAPIVTPRLRLEPLTQEHVRSFLAGDYGSVVTGDGWPQPDTADGLRMAAADPGARLWLVTLDGVVIGDCGTHGAPEATGDVEIGYGLAAPYRGQGYGAEVVTALTGWLRAQHAVGRVVAREVDAANVPSRRCLERAGFRLERDDGALVSYATARS